MLFLSLKFYRVSNILSHLLFQTVVSKRKDVFSSSEAIGMLECDWQNFVTKTKKVGTVKITCLPGFCNIQFNHSLQLLYSVNLESHCIILSRDRNHFHNWCISQSVLLD